ELVLFALHHAGKAGVVFENAEIELGDHLAARAVPDAKLRLDQPAADDLVHQPELGEHFQGRRMRGCGARAVVDARLRLEHVDWETRPRQRQRGDASDRPAAGHQYGPLGCLHLKISIRATGSYPPTRPYRPRPWH